MVDGGSVVSDEWLEVEPALVYWSQPGLDSRFSILDSRFSILDSRFSILGPGLELGLYAAGGW